MKRAKFRFRVTVTIGNPCKSALHSASAALYAKAGDAIRALMQQTLSIKAWGERRIRGRLLNPRGRKGRGDL